MEKKVFTGNYNNWWCHFRSGSGAKICARVFFETILSKVSSCQKEIYSENLNDISFFWLLSAALVYWIWKIILKWDNQEHREESLKALYICIFGKLFNIKEKLRVELRFLRKSMNQKTLPEGIFPAYIILSFHRMFLQWDFFSFMQLNECCFNVKEKKTIPPKNNFHT